MSAKRHKISPFVKQCFVTCGVCSNMIGYGCLLGFPAILLPQLHQPSSQVPLTKEADSWITSVVGITLLIGNCMMPPIMGRLGRRKAHLIATAPIIGGWITIILAKSVQDLIIGRILHGLSFGMILPLRSVLIGEYTSSKNRGAFLTTIALSQAFGIFFVHLIGSFLSWKTSAIISVSFSLISIVMTIFSPETPSWLADKERYDECRKVFHWLRGHDDDEELEHMIRAQESIKESNSPKINFREIVETLQKKEFYKPIILMAHAYCMCEFSGATVMACYSTTILSLLMGPDVNAGFWMIALDTQRIFSNAVAVYFINRLGRRTMTFITGSISVSSHIAIALYLYVKHVGYLTYTGIWIPAVLINLKIFAIAIGMVPLPSVIAGEVFPLQYRSIGGGISIFFVAASTFLVLKTYPGLIEAVGLHGTYAVYAGLLSYDMLVIWFMLPETRGKTLQQIEDGFRGRMENDEDVVLEGMLKKEEAVEKS